MMPEGCSTAAHKILRCSPFLSGVERPQLTELPHRLQSISGIPNQSRGQLKVFGEKFLHDFFIGWQSRVWVDNTLYVTVCPDSWDCHGGRGVPARGGGVFFPRVLP